MFHATLPHLRLFHSVAKSRDQTRAVEETHLSQPAVSLHLKRLEEQFGMPLSEKIGKRIFLTGAGPELLEACEDIFRRMSRLESSSD